MSAFYGFTAVIVTCIPLVSGILYSEPLLPASWGYRRLKEIPLVKNVLVAGAWALTLSLLPVYIDSHTPSFGTFITGLFFLHCVFIGSVLPDIRDREGDAIAGITTLPVLIGIRLTNVLLVAMASFLGGIILILGSRYYSSNVVLLLIIGIFYMLFCILSMDRLIKTNIVCDILADCVFIILGLVSFAFTIAGGLI